MRTPTEQELKEYKEISKSYKELEKELPRQSGLRIMLSPLVIEPKMLFIGINPAPWSENKKDLYDTNPNSGKSDFKFNPNANKQTDPIRRLIRQCFKDEDWMKLEGDKDGNDIVFINYTPFYTKKSSDLERLENTPDIKKKERELIHKLIALISPECIICGGTKGCYYRLRSNKDIEKTYISKQDTISKDVITAKYDDKIDVIAFARINNGFRGGKTTKEKIQEWTHKKLNKK